MKLIIIDLECTDSDLVKGDIVEIGAWYMPNPITYPTQSFHSRIQPLGSHRDPEAMAVHGITEEQLQTAPHCNDALGKFVGWCQTVAGGRRYTLGSWGTHFDIPYLRMQYKKVSARLYPHPGRSFDAKSYATAALIKRYGVDTQGARGCIKTAERLGASVKGLKNHSALDDAMAAALAVREATLTLLEKD